MRKIEVVKWKEPMRDGSEREATTVDALNSLLSMARPEKIPRGLDQFRLFSRLMKAFDRAKESGVLELEETEYHFLKRMVESDIPASWAGIPEVVRAIDLFIDAKEVE